MGRVTAGRCRFEGVASPAVTLRLRSSLRCPGVIVEARCGRNWHLVPLNSGPHAGEMEVVTPMTTMDVTCPPGCKEGDQVRIQSPSGQVIQVAVPPGVSPGQVFRAQVPAPTTVATASVAMKGELVA